VLEVETRDGALVRVAEAELAAGKVVPPPPVRRRGGQHGAVAAHLAPAPGELQEICSRAWPPTETLRTPEGWTLRAAGGFTRRANSALPPDEDEVGLETAEARVRGFYAERGLPALAQVVSGSPADEGLAARGWTPETPSRVLTAPLVALTAGQNAGGPAAGGPAAGGPAAGGPAAGGPVRVTREPSDGWFARYHQAASSPEGASAVLRGGPSVWFAAVDAPEGQAEDGGPVAIGRCAVVGRWAHLAAVEVAPAMRRRGLAVAVMRALALRAAAEGADLVVLQVEADNTPALALYERLGFDLHHAYRYRRAGG